MIDERAAADDDSGTVFRDVIFLALLVFVIMVYILILHFNPPTEESDAEPPGNLIFEISWPDKINSDIDLWVKAPGERAVGYSNKSGSELLNYLRDDLGNHKDPSFANFENVYSRGLRDGEYIVNLHYYRRNSRVKDVPVFIGVYLKPEIGGKKQTLFETRVVLDRPGKEITVVRFTMADGKFVRGSIRHSFIPIRSGRSPIYIPRVAQPEPAPQQPPPPRERTRQQGQPYGWLAPRERRSQPRPWGPGQ